ncbi:cytochrome c oxidase subunit II [Fodinicola feengrottensis]|uniref:cytochrome-c oxidase n=1 Tax=Fodinicola feengrottensis TaxID=435914 RepID=A0ABP4UEE1_9ACTN
MASQKRDRAGVPVRRGRAVLSLAGLGLLALALAGCDQGQAMRFGWPAGVTVQSQWMLRLWVDSTIAALAVGVLVWGLMFWAIIAYRRRAGDPEIPVQTKLNLPIEILYTIAPLLIVVVLFYYTAVVETDVNKEDANPDVTISVVAFKWNWRFGYNDQRGQDGHDVETVGSSDQIPVLVLPTGKTVKFIETSEDVIHSFWVPDFLFKRDVIPGHPNSFQVTITQTGNFVGRCAELCGTYHSNMNFEVRAVSPTMYQQYLTLREQGLSNPDALEKLQGKAMRYAVTTHPFNTDRRDTSAS